MNEELIEKCRPLFAQYMDMAWDAGLEYGQSGKWTMPNGLRIQGLLDRAIPLISAEARKQVLEELKKGFSYYEPFGKHFMSLRWFNQFEEKQALQEGGKEAE